jgi:streptogramin lyase
MTEVEQEIRRTLSDVLDPIEPRPLPMQTVHRAKARRALSAGLVGTTVLMVLAVASWGLLTLGERAIETPIKLPVGPPQETGPHSTRVVHGRIVELATAEGSVWAVTCDRRCSDNGRNSEGRAVRLDPRSSTVETSTKVQAPSNLAIGEGAVWVISFWDGTVTRIDPSTSSVAGTVALELPREIAPGDRQFLPTHASAGEGAVWVSTGRGAVVRIDPETNQVAATVTTPGDTTGDLVAGEGAVWVTQNVFGVYRIDPTTNRVVDEIPIEEGGRRLAIDGVAVGGGAVWVVGAWAEGSADATGHVEFAGTDEEAIYRIDPETNIPTRVDVAADHGSIAFGEGALWVTSRANHELSGVDPTSGEVTRTLALEQGERLLAVGGGAVWVGDVEGRARRIELVGP